MSKLYNFNNNKKSWLIHLSKIQSISNDNLKITASNNNNIYLNISNNTVNINGGDLEISNNGTLRAFGNSVFGNNIHTDNSNVKIPDTFNNYSIANSINLESNLTVSANQWIDLSNNGYKIIYKPSSNKSKILLSGKISYLANFNHNQLIHFKLSKNINNTSEDLFYDLSYGTSIATTNNGIYYFNYIDTPETSSEITYYLSYKINNTNNILNISSGIIGNDLSNLNSFIVQELYIPPTDFILDTINDKISNKLNSNHDASFNNVSISNDLIINGKIYGDGSDLSGISISNDIIDICHNNNLIFNFRVTDHSLTNNAEHNILFSNGILSRIIKNSNFNIIFGTETDININSTYRNDLYNNANDHLGDNNIKFNVGNVTTYQLMNSCIDIGTRNTYTHPSNLTKVKYTNRSIIIGYECLSPQNNGTINDRIVIGKKCIKLHNRDWSNDNGLNNCIAIGNDCAGFYRKDKDMNNSILIGDQCSYRPGLNQISIGARSGQINGGDNHTIINATLLGPFSNRDPISNNTTIEYPVSIGHRAQAKSNSIVISSWWTTISNPDVSSCVIKTIANNPNSNQLFYNSTTGEITYSEQRLFQISDNDTSNNSAIFSWNNESSIIDSHNNWSFTDNKYTIDISGYWRIYCQANVYNDSNINNVKLSIIKDTNTNIAHSFFQINHDTNDTSSNISVNVSTIEYLNKDDKIFINFNNSENVINIQKIILSCEFLTA